MILVFIENDNNSIKKSSFEALTYAGALAKQLGTEAHGVASDTISDDELASAGKFGVSKVYKINVAADAVQPLASAVAKIANEKGGDTVIMSHSSLGEAISSRIAIKLDGTVVTNVMGLPEGDKVKRSIYTGKAFSLVSVKTKNKVFTIKKNSFDVAEGSGSASVEAVSISISDADNKVKITGTKKQEGDILLPEADLVVSAGRGLKGPENWGMIEELAKILGAATACSKPVSDVDWRPHHEHVGQTGIKISPNLYIAVGISGAIQHLAGVSSSKVIVVINTDPEAPFFKAADYGIVGDAFDVVPKLIEALKNA